MIRLDELKRGAKVYSKEGAWGQLTGIVTNPITHQITHLIIENGFISKHSRILPISLIEDAGEDIYLRSSNDHLEECPHYIEDDIISEVQGRLIVAPFDTSAIKVSLKDGVLRLTGQVPDEAAKRDTKALVHSVEGVIYVENALNIEVTTTAKIASSKKGVEGSKIVPNHPFDDPSLSKEELLWGMTELYGLTVRAQNGNAGKVHDFYFDDELWAIRYLVVDLGDWVLDTGAWIPGKKVFVSAVLFGHPYRETRLLPVSLPREQVKHCPELNTFKALLNPPLYSAREIIGYPIQALDDEVGFVKDFIIDTKSWTFSSIVMATHRWWPSKKVIVPPIWVGQVDFTESMLNLNLPSEVIRRHPAFNSKTTLPSEY